MTIPTRSSFEQFAHFVSSATVPHEAGKYAVLGALADSKLACQLLAQAIPEARAGQWRLLSFQVRKIRRHHRKRIVMGLMSYQKEDRAIQTAEVIVKVYGSDRGRMALETLRQLWKAGFRSPGSYQVPRPYGYLPEEGALLQGTAPGTSWGDLVRTRDPSLLTGSARSASWLLQLQRSRLIGEPKSQKGAVESVQRWSQELAGTFSDHAHRLESVAARLIPALGADGLPLAPSHGDYHPMNIFLTPRLTTVIDFDTFALREAAFDVGYAIGQLLIMSYFQTGTFGPGAQAALAFWHQYQMSGLAPWNRVAIQVARTLFQSLHYELYTLRTSRLELLPLWTRLMEVWLDSSRTTILDGLRALPLQMGQVGVR